MTRIDEDQILVDRALSVGLDETGWDLLMTGSRNQEHESGLPTTAALFTFADGFSPHRMLVECETKRQLIHLINGADAAEFHRADEPAPTSEPYMRHDVAAGLLVTMAQPYADHSDFDPRWKIE